MPQEARRAQPCCHPHPPTHPPTPKTPPPPTHPGYTVDYADYDYDYATPPHPTPTTPEPSTSSVSSTHQPSGGPRQVRAHTGCGTTGGTTQPPHLVRELHPLLSSPGVGGAEQGVGD